MTILVSSCPHYFLDEYPSVYTLLARTPYTPNISRDCIALECVPEGLRSVPAGDASAHGTLALEPR